LRRRFTSAILRKNCKKIRDELDSIENKLRKNQLRDAIRQLDYVIDDVDRLIDDVNRYDPMDDVDDEDVAYVCYNWGCKCPDG
jgi:methionyl-tRNA synthetase